MSVRDKIEEFEALNHSTDDGEPKNDANAVKKKRFALPSKDYKTKEQDQLPLIKASRSKTTVLSGMEADLQDVWSVRKNIQHYGQSQKRKSGTATLAAAQYSRHGAIPAQPAPGPQIPKGTESTEKGYNSESQPWSVRAPNFSYSEAAKRPIESPNNDHTSPPLAKRKNIPDVIRPTNHLELPPLVKSNDAQDNNKKNYAKKMAQAHLRSVGMGEFTPKRDNYHPDTSNKATMGEFTPKRDNYHPDTSNKATMGEFTPKRDNYHPDTSNKATMGEFTPKRDNYHPDTSNKATKWKRRDSDEFDFET